VYDKDKIDNFYEKSDLCGLTYNEFLKLKGRNQKFFDVKQHCNNRACSRSGCKKHRLYLYMRNHKEQIYNLQKSMRKPKAWIFSGWKIHYKDFDKSFARKKLLFLFRLLSNEYYGSVSEFSIHMELKMYPAVCNKWSDECKKCFYYTRCKHNDACPSYEMVYLHFHVVTAGIKDLKIVRKLWGRNIRYESAINVNDLSYYVSKYASKTPYFAYKIDQEIYHCMVYKMQMHRFSCKKDADLLKVEPGCLPVDLFLMLEGVCMKSRNFRKKFDGSLVRVDGKLRPPPCQSVLLDKDEIDFGYDDGVECFVPDRPRSWRELVDYLEGNY
jgi:hypothetical protein